jgi:hypothetical protein
MDMGFTTRCCTRADDANAILAGIRMGDEQEALRCRHPERHESTLVVGMVRVVESFGQRIQKDRLALVERDTVLAEVRRGANSASASS